MMAQPPTLLGIVGPCAAGKTTLVSALRARGVSCKAIAQEHSYVPDMWQRLTRPELLIFLEVSYPVTVQRRKLDWTVEEYETQLYRLRHAYQHADLRIATDQLTPQQILERVLEFLDQTRNP
jgi:deoxyadenosine/deoxycytidine kinase